MHFYSMGYKEVLALPVSVFWGLAKNVDRVRAEEDQRMFLMLQNIMGGDPKAYFRSLKSEQGTVMVVSESEKLDRKGLRRLRQTMGA